METTHYEGLDANLGAMVFSCITQNQNIIQEVRQVTHAKGWLPLCGLIIFNKYPFNFLSF